MRQKDFGNIGQRWRWLFWETLIIVLGVLIAFGVNDYWTDRQDRALELQYLKRLRADLNSDIEWLKRYNAGAMRRKFAALDAMAPVVRGLEPVPDDLETFLINVTLGGIGGASPTYFVTATTFEDIKATGNLPLIRDKDMRGRLSSYYIRFERTHPRIMVRRTGYFMFVHAILPAERRDNISMEAIEEFGVDRALVKVMSPEFLDLINQEYNFAYFIENVYAEHARVSSELAAEVEAHIRKLEGT